MKFFKIYPQAASALLIVLFVFAVANPRIAVGQEIGSDLLPDGTKSDGCTLIGGKEFRACCVAHDREYFLGGTLKERRAADKRLYECVRKTHSSASKFKAVFIWLGVRIGGMRFLPTPFRWGFGKKPKINSGIENVKPDSGGDR
ncbi:MAG: hypothetical protein ACRD6X_03625 [Pyrinomonadaceae bacterium]